MAQTYDHPIFTWQAGECGVCPDCGGERTPEDMRESHAIEQADGSFEVLCRACDDLLIA